MLRNHKYLFIPPKKRLFYYTTILVFYNMLQIKIYNSEFPIKDTVIIIFNCLSVHTFYCRQTLKLNSEITLFGKRNSKKVLLHQGHFLTGEKT